MIDTLSQASTDAALDDIVARPQYKPPEAPGFSIYGLARGAAKGIGGGVSQGIAFGAEMAGAFGQVAGSLGDVNSGGMFSLPTDAERRQQEAARQKVLKEGVDYSSEAGDLFRARASEIMPDPQTTHASEQVVAGLTNFATKAIGYSLTAGPGAPLLLGGDTALTEADKLKQEGVDLSTRTKAAAVAGAVAGASIVLPVVGSTALKTAGLVGLVGPGGFIAQNATTKAILEHAGYDKIANQYDPFDPVGLAVSTLVPAAFGAAFHTMKATGPIKTEADVRSAAQLSPAEQAHSDAYERSPENIAALQQAVAAEKRPEAKAILQAELDTQTKAAAAHASDQIASAARNDPDVVPAARVQQVAETLDSTRLSADDDIGGMSAHQDAIERAHEQIAAGEPVDVQNLLGPLDPDRIEAMQARVREFAELPTKEEAVRARVEPVFDALDASVNRMRATLESSDRASLDISDQVGKAKQLLDKGSAQDAIARAVAAGTELHPTVNNLLIGAHEGATLPQLVDRYTEHAIAAKPGAKAHDLAADAVTSTRSGKAPANEVTPAARASVDALVANPDLMVHLDGMDKPMRAADLLAQVHREAAGDIENSRLVQVAANCLLGH